MFEKRLKIILLFFGVITLILMARAFQVQVFSRSYWQIEAMRVMTRDRTLETLRGRILDVKGRVIAEDRPCIDAAVDFRAIKPGTDDKWLKDQARIRLRSKYAETWDKFPRDQRQKLLDSEVDAVKSDIEKIWPTLAAAGGLTMSEMQSIREGIIEKVEARKRRVAEMNFRAAVGRYNAQDESTWKSWLLGGKDRPPEIGDYEVTVGEEISPHVVLHAIDVNLQNTLAKQLDRLPGVVLLPNTKRVYPYGRVACHVIGNLAKVTPPDRANDPEFDNPLRRYDPSDDIGRTGLESLFEPTLRGSRGNESTVDAVTSITADPIVGKDVRTTIDMDLQATIEDLFTRFKFNPTDKETVTMHGAAVVLDVGTNEVRALVSSPGFDLNRLDELYPKMVFDDLNKPLMNRATQAQLEPGSTVKTIVGMAAVTLGIIQRNTGIECTGYLVLNNRKFNELRCWTASKWGRSHPSEVAHHQIPSSNPHRGTYPNADGFLTYVDAIERSCNVFFETVADKLGAERLSEWMEKFGIGRPSGIGLPEAIGRLPRDYHGPLKSYATWSAGIGQGSVNATPIQMAGVAATIARKGIWMRPKLARGDVQLSPYIPRRADAIKWKNIPERLDLGVSDEAMQMVKEGMIRVVNDDGGTGKAARRTDMIVAGKTGTAETTKLFIRQFDPATGKFVIEDGREKKIAVEPSTPLHPNPAAPWYRGYDDDQQKLKHAWFIGFAPAENPTVAFCVMVEYGGSGNAVAGPIVAGVLDACVEMGYLPRKR